MKLARQKSILSFLLALAFVAAVLGFAQTTNAQVDLGMEQVSSSIGLGNTDIRVIVAKIIRAALSLLGIVAVVLVLYGGYMWMTAGGDEERIGQAKKILINSAIGLAIILSAYAITSFVMSRLITATTGGDNTGGSGGGGAGGNPYMPSSIFYVDSLPKAGTLCIRNVHFAITFNIAIDAGTIDGNLAVEKEDGTPASGSWNVSGNVAEFIPSGDCGSAPNDCLESSTKYTLKFKNSPDIKSDDGLSLNCAVKAGCGNVDIITGDGVDRVGPQVEIQNIASDALKVNSVVPVTVNFTDDNGVQKMDFRTDSYFVESQTLSGCQKSGSVTFNWPTTGLPSGAHSLQATGFDWTMHQSSDDMSVNLLPPHCFDNELNFDEQKAGPPACGGDCGACSGASCTSNTDCSSGYCEIPDGQQEGVCVDKMRINGISPASGGPGTFVSVSGNYFGTAAGKVYINNELANLASCGAGNSWKPWQIIAEVPVGAESGPIKVETAAGSDGKFFTDTTNDDFGPSISDFTVNSTVHPGLCTVVPNSAKSGDEVELIGKNFGNSIGKVYFGQTAGVVGISNWADSFVTARVPLLSSGNVGLKVTRNSVDSNSIKFFVESNDDTNAPIISSITPEKGAKGEYITIIGSNFGDDQGRVWFKLVGADGQPSGDAIEGDFNFPSECGQTWFDNQIIVKFPLNKGEIGKSYFVLVRPADASKGWSFIGPVFKLEAGEPKPGICSISPLSGPVPFSSSEATLQIAGQYFGSSPKPYFWTFAAEPDSINGRIESSAVSITKIGDLDIISTQPPVGTQSGPIVVLRPIDEKVSNPKNFDVSNCLQTNFTCSESNTHCCATGVEAGTCKPTGSLCDGETLSAGYVWRFSTKEIPKVPRVVERCNRETENGNNLPTPSPSIQWDSTAGGDHHNVCKTAAIVVEFNLNTINPISESNILINECETSSVDPAGKNCSASAPVQIFGSGDIIPSASTESKSYIELYPDVSYNTGKWKEETWYQIVLKDGITAGSGDQLANLAKDNSCNVAGSAYCFLFKSGDEDCKMKDLIVTPYSYLTRMLESPVMQRVNGESPKNLFYSAHGLSDQKCIIMDVKGFNWGWDSAKILYSDIVNGGDTQDHAQVSALRNTVGIGLSNPKNAVNIIARASTGTISYSKGSPLTIDLNDPEVVGFWPNCNESCTNAEIAARFNTTMSNQNLETAVNLFECADENCYAMMPVPINPYLDADSQYTVLKIENLSALAPGKIYKVILSASSSLPSANQLWSASTLGDPNTYSKPYNKEFSWRFKTKSEECKITRVEVSPKVFTSSKITDRAVYKAVPYSSPDSCDPKGQALNPWQANWTWASSDLLVAEVKTFSTNGSNPYCTKYCVRKGSDIPAGKAIVPVCGNNVVEAGEDCDAPNKDQGCGLNCLRMGTSTPDCGNGLVEPAKGEECDTQDATTKLGCGSNCLRQGSSKEAQDSTSSICGNAYIGSGEDCDIGIADSAVQPNSGMGCSDNCLHLGTKLSKNWCSNTVDHGGFTIDEFNNACKNALSQCGDKVVSPDEDPGCDNATTGWDSEECDSRCLLKNNDSAIDIDANLCPATGYSQGCANGKHIGSSLSYATPSVCGDGNVGIGEDKFCETNLSGGHSGKTDPWTLVTGVGMGVPDDAGNPTQSSDISAKTSDGTASGEVTGAGKFEIPCGFTTDQECKLNFGNEWSLGKNTCCYQRPQLLSVYPGSTSSIKHSICPNTVIEAVFDQEMDPASVNQNFILARGIGKAHPTEPVLLSEYNAPEGIINLDAAGNYAYLAIGGSGLRILNLASSTNPVEAGILDTDGAVFAVEVQLNMAFLADASGGLRVIDLSDKSIPKLIGSLGLGFARDLAVVNNKAYVAVEDSGLKIVNVNNKTSPSLEGSVSTGIDYANGVFVKENYAYIANGNNGGLKIVDVSKPDEASVVGSLQINGTASDVVVQGNVAYLANGMAGLGIIDISSSTKPVLITEYSAGTMFNDVYYSGGYLFAATGGSVDILDISDPSSPSLKKRIEGPAHKIRVSGDTAYLSYGPNFKTIDLSFLTTYDCSQNEDVTNLLAANYKNNLPWYKKIINRIAGFIKGLFGNEVTAIRTDVRSVKWCAGSDLGKSEVIDNGDGSSRVSINLSEPFKTDSDYAIILKEGMRDQRGASIGKNSAGKNISWKFITAPRICEIEKVRVIPPQVLLDRVGASTTLNAIAYSSGGGKIQPIPEYYSWEYLWQPFINPYVALQETTSTVNTISALNRSGEVDVRGTVNIVENNFSGELGAAATGKSHAIVFLCERPWPPKNLAKAGGPFVIFPYEDKKGNNDGYDLTAQEFDNTGIPAATVGEFFNFSSYYCADNGAYGSFDDLPYMRPAVQINAQQVTSTSITSLKRFIFSNNKNSDAIGIQVFSNPAHLTIRDWFERAKDEGGVGFMGEMRDLKVDGYEAITDGNNVYVDSLNANEICAPTCGGKYNIYTNIYLFSINADAEPDTRKVFEQMMSNLKFNTNLTNYRYCGLSIENPGTITTCMTDLDCSAGEICSAQVDKLKRNYLRLRDLKEINDALE